MAAADDACAAWLFIGRGVQGPGAAARLQITGGDGKARTIFARREPSYIHFRTGDVLTCTHGSVRLSGGNQSLFLRTELHAVPRHGERRRITADQATSDALIAEENRARPPRAAVTGEGLDLRFCGLGDGVPIAPQYSHR